MSSPNLAFTEIRDNENKYFRSAILVFTFSIVVEGVMFIPFLFIEIPEDFIDEYLPILSLFETIFDTDVVVSMILGAIGAIIFIVVFFYVGRILKGNRNYRQVFSVMFYSVIPLIPMFIIINFAIGSLIISGMGIVSDTNLTFEDGEIPSELHNLVTIHLGIFIIGLIVFLPWWIITVIKATKIVNGFGTAKAIGLVILVSIISLVVQMVVF